MNSENACQTSTGNYTTSGMSQQCRMLEAIQKSLPYCAFVVTDRRFHSSLPTSCASAFFVLTLVLLFSLLICNSMSHWPVNMTLHICTVSMQPHDQQTDHMQI